MIAHLKAADRLLHSLGKVGSDKSSTIPLMRILLLTGIQEELLPVLNPLQLTFRQHGAYQSVSYPELYAATTGPGLKKKSDVRTLLKELQPEVIINAGLVGVLVDRKAPAPGDLIHLASVVDAESELVYPINPHGETLVTVKAPVFEPREKWLLARQFHADFCDMEAARIIRLVRQVDEVREESPVLFLKVVGDMPDHYELYKHEELVRGWHRQSVLGRIRTGLKFPGGPGNLRRLLKLKEAALNGLTLHVSRSVKALLGGADPAQLGPLFVPA